MDGKRAWTGKCLSKLQCLILGFLVLRRLDGTLEKDLRRGRRRSDLVEPLNLEGRIPSPVHRTFGEVYS